MVSTTWVRNVYDCMSLCFCCWHKILLVYMNPCKRVLFICLFVCFWRDRLQWARASSFTRLLDHTQQRKTFGRTPLEEGSGRQRDIYLKTHNIRNRYTSVSPVRFEPTISAGEQPQTYILDRAATGTGSFC